jgi:hypothetical protein
LIQFGGSKLKAKICRDNSENFNVTKDIQFRTVIVIRFFTKIKARALQEMQSKQASFQGGDNQE